MIRSLISIITLAMLVCLAGCVKIETGQTVEEAQESASQRARNVRATWANKLADASPREIAFSLVDHFDQTIAMFLRYGDHVRRQWLEGNEGRGVAIEAAEMRKVVDSWIAGEKPLLEAYDDNLDYGYALVKESGFYDERVLSQLNSLVNQYYDVYSAVFLPTGNLDDYTYRLDQAKYGSEQMSDETRAILSGF